MAYRKPSDDTNNASSLDMDTTVKSEPADGGEQLEEDHVYSVKQELEIGPEVLQPHDQQYIPQPCKPEPAGDTSPIVQNHLIKNELNAADTQESSGAVRSSSRAQFIFDFCSNSFIREAHLQRHMLIHTGGPHECGVCKKMFSLRYNLYKHKLTHTGGPHKCDICKTSFSQKIHLTNHMLFHTGVIPNKCGICNKRISLGSNLKDHMLAHTSNQHNKCHICENTFSRKTDLNRHMLTHTREQPHKCDICKKGFSQKNNLNRHMLAHR